MTRLSVVVGLTSGSTTVLRRCLQALVAQHLEPHEILVPYDTACAHVTSLQAEFPSVRFIEADGADTAAARAGASREHHDLLRTVGIRAVTGDSVALIEDYHAASPGWTRALVAGLQRHPDGGAVGGAIDCDSDTALGWAQWLSDFGRYQSPMPAGPTSAISDTNVVYPVSALTRIAGVWADVYREPAVHLALSRSGQPLYMVADAPVRQRRPPVAVATAVRERYVWGRSFGATRPDLSRSGRLLLTLLSPLLPLLLTTRIIRTVLARGRALGRLVTALPLVALLAAAWTLGEVVGYLTGKADGGAGSGS